jgi:hypothetical protein
MNADEHRSHRRDAGVLARASGPRTTETVVSQFEPLKLDYVEPQTRRDDEARKREKLIDLLDLLGGPRGLLLIIAIAAVLLGPHQRNWIGGTSMVVGGIVIETLLIMWFKKR